jgi:hypothetical protein
MERGLQLQASFHFGNSENSGGFDVLNEACDKGVRKKFDAWPRVFYCLPRVMPLQYLRRLYQKALKDVLSWSFYLHSRSLGSHVQVLESLLT